MLRPFPAKAKSILFRRISIQNAPFPQYRSPVSYHIFFRHRVDFRFFFAGIVFLKTLLISGTLLCHFDIPIFLYIFPLFSNLKDANGNFAKLNFFGKSLPTINEMIPSIAKYSAQRTIPIFYTLSSFLEYYFTFYFATFFQYFLNFC